MKKHVLQVIACAANVFCHNEDIFYGATAEHADNNFSFIPDFISHCGMAHAFNYLMSNKVNLNAE